MEETHGWGRTHGHGHEQHKLSTEEEEPKAIWKRILILDCITEWRTSAL